MKPTDITKTMGWANLCAWHEAGPARTIHLRLSSWDVGLQLVDCSAAVPVSSSGKNRSPDAFDALVEETIAGSAAQWRRMAIEAEVRAEVERRMLDQASSTERAATDSERDARGAAE